MLHLIAVESLESCNFTIAVLILVFLLLRTSFIVNGFVLPHISEEGELDDAYLLWSIEVKFLVRRPQVLQLVPRQILLALNASIIEKLTFFT